MFRFIQKSFIVVLVGILTPLLAGCQTTDGPKLITPKGDEIALELAITPQQQEQGLMLRPSLPENSGMLFLFAQMQVTTFWMKDTLIPLDVVFIDDKDVVVDIQTMAPCPQSQQSCPTYPAKAAAKYAVEINAGKAQKIGLKVGDQLILKIPSIDHSSTR